MNVPKERLDAIIEMIPSITAPTVSPLYKTEWFAIETVIAEARVRELIPAAAQARRRRDHRVPAQQGHLRGVPHVRPRSHRCSSASASTSPLALVAVLAAAGCSQQSVEDRARETLEKIQKSMVDVEAVALEQKADPAVVSEVQRNLTAINEYQGEINGKLDSVTINAIQAFQRTAGLKDDGIITDATRQKLAAAAGQAKS